MPKHKVEEITLSVKTNSLESSFSKLALSLFNIVVDTSEIKPDITKTIILSSNT
mgnify:CR=1 FL=1